MIKNLFNKIIKKKDNGDIVGTVLPLILTTVAIAAIAVIFSSWMMNVDRKNDLDVIARRYMLIMESEGGLRSEDETELRDELASAGLKNINITSQTSRKTDDPTTDPGYGQKIVLAIEGDMEAYNYQFIDFFNVDTSKGTLPIEIVKVSTAKH